MTVACVWVRGNVPYSPEYVTNLQRMVARHVSAPHRFVCLTDQPWQLKDVETIPVPSVGDLFGWWAKIELFKPERFEGRVLYLDLDTLVVNSLDPIVDFPSSFALIPNAGHFTPRTHHQVVKRFNSSVMVWEAGVNTQLYTSWTSSISRKYWGDQDWIGLTWPQAAMMPLEWFPRLSSIQDGPVPSDAIVVLAKKPKPEEAAERWAWVQDVWRAA